MRLKSLKLAGFKSFANPTTFTFKHDITAIVGPNGCGKSNVIDAIRWVLGETSAKQLRGGAMSDVIFAGVEGRAAKSLASVELVFEHTQDETHGIRHELNLYQELSLRRQVTKDGKSDYFINGQRVRRRDVVDVFLGTGLGARSYAVIEQGMIGRIVESSPMQLREFIEEGAGVSRYQARRAETEKQLAETQDNLQRLSDLQGELKKQHKTLIRQAQSAKEYEALNEELAKLHHDDLIRRLFEAWQYHETKKAEQSKLGQELAELEANANKVRKELDELSAKVAEGQWLKDEAKDKYHNAQMAEQTAQHNFYTLNSQISQNDEKINRLTAQHQEASQSIEQAQNELVALEARLADINPQLELASQRLTQIQQSVASVQVDWQKQRDELNTLTNEKNTLENTQKLTLAQIERVKTNQQRWQKKFDDLQQSIASMQIDETLDEQIVRCQNEIDTLTLKLDAFDEQTLKGEFEAMNQQVQTAQKGVLEQEKRHATLMGEYEILHKLVHHQKATTHQEDQAGMQSLPSLKDEIRLSKQGEQYTSVLDTFLGFWLDAKISAQMMTEGIWTSPKQINAVLHTGNATPRLHDDRLIALGQLIDAPKLTLFAQCYLFDGELTEFETMAEQLDLAGVLVLTSTGWLVGAFGMVHMSKFGEHQGEFLSQRQLYLQRLAQLEEELGQVEDELEIAQKSLKSDNAKLDTLKISLEEMLANRQSTTAQLNQAQQTLIRLDADQKTQKIKQDNLQKSQQLLEQERQELQQELAQLAQDEQAGMKKLAEFEPRLVLATQAMATQTALIDEQNAKLKTCQEEYQALQLQHHTLTQSQTHAQKVLQMTQHTLTQTLLDIENTHHAQEQLSQELPVLEQQFTQAKQHSHELKIVSQEHEEAVKVLQLGQAKLQEALTTAHGLFMTAQTQSTQLTADTAVGESRLQDIGDELMRLDEKFNLPATLADFRHQPNRHFEDNTAQQEAIKQKIIKLGAVNLAAAAELAELESRVSPMDTQIADITQSMTKLQDAIKAIDEKTKSLFLNALSAVNRELNTLFSKVFGGGQASLTLMDDESLSKADKWRAGLVLMAQPKGKKNSRLAVLSGGEKTLTALSLIFAIFKQHPAPFCVLDEVDAPLDDANVARFTGLIHELASDVQFIFISHNKLAMQIADELKGITMPTAGISSLVTVNLEEAQQYLDAGV